MINQNGRVKELLSPALSVPACADCLISGCPSLRTRTGLVPPAALTTGTTERRHRVRVDDAGGEDCRGPAWSGTASGPGLCGGARGRSGRRADLWHGLGSGRVAEPGEFASHAAVPQAGSPVAMRITSLLIAVRQVADRTRRAGVVLFAGDQPACRAGSVAGVAAGTWPYQRRGMRRAGDTGQGRPGW
jgi:hypothetical protein